MSQPPTETSGFKREVMKVTIDLGEGHDETILVREGESAEMVARAFAVKFKLPEDTEFLLREQIQYNLSQLQNQTFSDLSVATLSKSQITQKETYSTSVPELQGKVKQNINDADLKEEKEDKDDLMHKDALDENKKYSRI